MLDTVESLILDLLEWVDFRPRSYDEVMSAWRTSCPRLPVWEDANDRGLVEIDRDSTVRLSSAGRALIGRKRRANR